MSNNLKRFFWCPPALMNLRDATMDVDPSRRVDWLEIELRAVIDNALEAPEMMYRQYQLQNGYAVEDSSDLIIPPMQARPM